MQKAITALLISVFLHLILLLSFSLVLTYHTILREKEPEPEIFIPSYVLSDALTASISRTSSNQTQSKDDEQPKVKEGIETGAKAVSFNDYAANQYRTIRSNQKINPVHLIGEKLIDDPLRKLLGLALTSHLVYPKVAMQLRMRGTVSIELLLSPDGGITNIRLIKSSRHKVLDVAALNAVHDMAPVRDVNLYIKTPKLLVFNVIF